MPFVLVPHTLVTSNLRPYETLKGELRGKGKKRALRLGVLVVASDLIH